ncbi:hypothetical protein A3A93_02915 [Candidatus Roizmanbacteria bacterium RIFCSPLOWO2_01_FULL_38_12]|uniref:Uncharacterized protein n=1 Tax=Candidatus Roizmanbacteria bacterium RIFCSPLOWO2_01_FULL_38_12 TaxID=1802061 RepID=A0A1F7IZH2_9BACT|nr:MAG: hypothetical protein A3F59_06005 [Candidatus Roizmanbacteria bacterium RIFCSPHIGHO2_12_FULL_38_13]OGK48758.1 MAG: hypothetical protein A3A93_02915 [Candidatus Roizmanbacteria bacterium RIFCSPLOWO2_01_FULL_38_12]
MAIKERRTKILLALLLMSGEDFYFVKFDNVFLPSFDLTLNRKTLSTLKNLEKEMLIEKNTDINLKHPTYRLTSEGFKNVSLIFPVFRFTKDKWDGIWRILSYEIPEKKRELRDRLRREVASWGLGPWHRSFWLTPHPVIPILKELITGEEKTYVQAFESSHVFGDREILIEKVWNKSQLEKNYRTLFMKWHDILSKDEDKIKKMKDVVNHYVDILKVDPGLPKELLGEKWIGFEAISLFREIRAILMDI